MSFKFSRHDVFSSSGWIPVNKALARELGLDASVIYGELTRKEAWYIDHGNIKAGDWFYVTHEDLENSTTLKRSKQDKAINALIKSGLIEKKMMGLPAKRYFRIIDDGLNFIPPNDKSTKDVENQQPDKINASGAKNDQKTDFNPQYNQVVENQQPRAYEKDNQGCLKSTGNNNNLNNNKLNKKSIKNNNNNSSSSYLENNHNIESEAKNHPEEEENYEMKSINQSLENIYDESNSKKGESEEEGEYNQLHSINPLLKNLFKEMGYNTYTIRQIEKKMIEHNIYSFTKEQVINQHRRMVQWIEKNKKEIIDWATFFVDGVLMNENSHRIVFNQNRINHIIQEKKRLESKANGELGWNPIESFRQITKL